ncbi:MAG: hypothetical protein ACLSWI_04325, partial [Candidatus Gastranaerophilaceae bacterium]
LIKKIRLSLSRQIFHNNSNSD